MLKYTLKILIPITIFFLVGCAGKGVKPVPKSMMSDLDEVRSLTKSELDENEKVLDNCLEELMYNYEETQKPKGEVFIEQGMKIG